MDCKKTQPKKHLPKAGLLIFLLLHSWVLFGQDDDQKLAYFWVKLHDKQHNPFSVAQPEAFLSQRALERRQQQGIGIESEDLPVSPAYLDQLRAFGAQVKHTSRWLNGATILLPLDSATVVSRLPMVDTLEYVGRYNEYRRESSLPNRRPERPDTNLIQEHYYGYGHDQISVLRGEYLHRLGYTGKGVLVGVLDGGFINADIVPFFDSLKATGRLAYHRDFVEDDTEVFESSSHGTMVLSLMGANLQGLLVGTAPGASYVCMKTENVRGEYRLEEYNWVAALEYADSLGVDVVNSSLGYTTFSDASMNYSYSQLDGRTSMASLAADIAFSKGMIIVNSAGNDGNSRWKYIGVPADGDCIFTVGATDRKGKAAGFSSKGPTADGRIKPDVSAPGFMVAMAAPNGDYRVKYGSGTSFAAPIVAGLIASLWEAFPDKNNAQILEAVRNSASIAPRPDTELGYGLPDFAKAYQLLKETAATAGKE